MPFILGLFTVLFTSRNADLHYCGFEWIRSSLRWGIFQLNLHIILIYGVAKLSRRFSGNSLDSYKNTHAWPFPGHIWDSCLSSMPGWEETSESICALQLRSDGWRKEGSFCLFFCRSVSLAWKMAQLCLRDQLAVFGMCWHISANMLRDCREGRMQNIMSQCLTTPLAWLSRF